MIQLRKLTRIDASVIERQGRKVDGQLQIHLPLRSQRPACVLKHESYGSMGLRTTIRNSRRKTGSFAAMQPSKGRPHKNSTFEQQQACDKKVASSKEPPEVNARQAADDALQHVGRVEGLRVKFKVRRLLICCHAKPEQP